MTAAANTGPANGPRPASSHPASMSSSWRKFFRFGNFIFILYECAKLMIFSRIRWLAELVIAGVFRQINLSFME